MMKRIASLLVACVLLCQLALVLAESGTNWVCPNCQTSNSGNFCTECGEKKPSACPNCQASLPEGASFKFCPSCGSSLTGADQAPASEATTAPEAPAALASPTAAPATSAGLIDLMQQHLDTYPRNLFLTPESYPEIVLMLDLDLLVIDRMESQGFNYVHISCPDDAVPIRFFHHSCTFINEAEKTVYKYTTDDHFDYEASKARDPDAKIIKDGSDGIAVHVIPYANMVEAVISVSEIMPEISTSTKIILTILNYGLSESLSDQEKVDILSKKITAEVERITSSIQVKHHDHLWTYGRFSSLTMRHFDSFNDYYVFSDPEFIVTQADNTLLAGLYIEEKEQYGIWRLKGVEINLSNSQMADAWDEKSGSNVVRHVLSNGAEAVTNLEINKGTITSSQTEFQYGIGRSDSGEIPLFMDIYIGYAPGLNTNSPEEVIAQHIEPLLSHMVIHHDGD